MLSKIISGTLTGIEAAPVIVETDLHPGLPALNMVGLASTTVKEAGERIRSAITNTGYGFPCKRITINFSPAATRKEGSHFDLPIAMGILTSVGELSPEMTGQYGYIGELSLDGNLGGIKGALPLVLGLRNAGVRKIILPKANVHEAAIVEGLELYPATNLSQVIMHMETGRRIRQHVYINEEKSNARKRKEEDYADVFGQQNLKRVMMICAAGFHGLLMLGSPGAGKSMLARRLPSIMPAMTPEEILETTQIYSVAGELSEGAQALRERPFRAPYHTISPRALVGGGTSPGPGEISLAHGGVLFMDELLEFSRQNLELLRQPMEDGKINISRRGETVTFPCRSILVAASNPCPCGHRGDPRQECKCSDWQVQRYMSKLSAPLLDRIDMRVSVQQADYDEFTGEKSGRACKSSAEMRAEVEEAATIQRQRYVKEGILYNAQMDPGMIRRHCSLGKEEKELMRSAYERMSLSARSYHKILKVSRTIADLSGAEKIAMKHLLEALQYRHAGEWGKA